MSTRSAAPPRHTATDRRLAVLIGLVSVLMAAALASLTLGAMPIGPYEVVSILMSHLGMGVLSEIDPLHDAVVIAVRLPRLLVGATVGAGLAIAGTVLQAVFRNPLADPALIGVSSGAALAAAAVTILGGVVVSTAASGFWIATLPVAAFTGGWSAVQLVQRLGRSGQVISVARLLLAGIAVNALAQALTGVLLFIATDSQLRGLLFWNLGSLGAGGWMQASVSGPVIVVATVALSRYGQPLNLMLLGDDAARHLGVDVEQIKRRVVLWATLAVSASVAVVGIIGFVGLVVPHLLRLTLGADHRVLLPATALLGASLLLVSDVFARTLAAPAEIPIGVVTALVGGPFFLWLIVRDDTVRTLR